MLISSFFFAFIESSSSAFICTSISIIVPAPEPSGHSGHGADRRDGTGNCNRTCSVSPEISWDFQWSHCSCVLNLDGLWLLRWLFLGWRHFVHFLGDTKKTAFWSVLDGGSNPPNLAKGPRRHGLISQWWWTQPPMIILVLLRELPPSFGPKFLAGDVDVYQMDVIDGPLLGCPNLSKYQG